MTADECIEKLILDIAFLRSGVNGSHQFSADDYQQYLMTHGEPIDLRSVETLLAGLAERGEMDTITIGLPYRFRITKAGAERMQALHDKATDEAAAILAIDDAIAAGPEPAPVHQFSLQVSEAALDGWWESLDMEIKIDLFNHFYEEIYPNDREEEEVS
jgi:hypothetical protein